uniref:FABP domain-containing protein n=1 Tax=Panagrellus redivivus TaxID=6233 RepID=A0A7E4VTR7_PANRE
MSSDELTPKQQAIVGKWLLDRAENFDEYMKGIGINAIKRAIGNRIKPTVVISRGGSCPQLQLWKVSVKSTFKNEDWEFGIGERTKRNTIDGRCFLTTVTWDGDVLVEKQEVCNEDPNAVPSTIRRSVNDDGELVAECLVGDVVAKRFFKRVD